MQPPVDVTGKPIKVGDVIAYPTRTGSSLDSYTGVVCEVSERYIVIQKVITKDKAIWENDEIVGWEKKEVLKRVFLLTYNSTRYAVLAMTKAQFMKKYPLLGVLQIIRYTERKK